MSYWIKGSFPRRAARSNTRPNSPQKSRRDRRQSPVPSARIDNKSAGGGAAVEDRMDALLELRQNTPDPLEEYRNHPDTRELEIIRKLDAEG
jgi:hypothetical protein